MPVTNFAFNDAHGLLACAAMAKAFRAYLQAGKTRTAPWTAEELRAFLASAIKNTTCDTVEAGVELGGKRFALNLLDSIFDTSFDEPVTIGVKKMITAPLPRTARAFCSWKTAPQRYGRLVGQIT